MTRQTKGIILQKKDFREDDRLFVIYTEDLGKIETIARGARKIKSKMAGHLDYFSVINFMLAPGKSYYQIAGAEIETNFTGIKNNLVRVVFGSYCLEIIDNFVKIGQADRALFKLIEELFFALSKITSKNILLFQGISKLFVLKLFALLGLTPELFFCVKCKNKIKPNKNFFNPILGGVVCEHCFEKFDVRLKSENILISTSAIKILRFAIKNNFNKILALKINKNQLDEVIKIMNLFLLINKDKELKTDKWISYLTQLSKT